MNTDFRDFEEHSRSRFGERFVPGEYDSFMLVLDSGVISFFRANGDPDGNVFIRAKIVDISELRRPGDFAKAALAGNFFWSGTDGATISADDEAFYLTERRLLDEFMDDESFMNCLSDFSSILADWRERSVLYA
ncbi:MAG: type III secretion system chaperone [Victivallales bacterium]|nr:type III secretion system chaperone [Victivallales bacterium]